MKHTARHFLRKMSQSNSYKEGDDDDVMKQHGIMVVVVLIVKQPSSSVSRVSLEVTATTDM